MRKYYLKTLRDILIYDRGDFMKVISVRDYPDYEQKAIAYIFSKWGSVNNYLCYHDCIEHSINVESPVPRWYLLLDDEKNIIGCGGLLSNDFISRMDFTPWLSSLYVEENMRGQNFGSKLIEYIVNDAKNAGYNKIYLATEHIGYYEKYGFEYVATGYHPWGESSRIYTKNI